MGETFKKSRAGQSCLVCRQKKIKCDKEKPVCSGCVKRGRAHLCHYDQQEWSLKVTNDQKRHRGFNMKQSKYQKLIDNPMSSESTSPRNNHLPGEATPKKSTPKELRSLDNDVLDFYSNSYASPVSLTRGALSWVALLTKDLYLNMIGISAHDASRPKHREMNQRYLSNLKKEKVEPVTSSLEKTQDDLTSQLNFFLSDGRLVWLLVDRYFDSEFNLLLPFLDQSTFRQSLIPILGGKTDGSITLALTKRTDITTLGILLLIMRFTSLSFYNFGKPVQDPIDENSQYMLSHPITKDIIPLVNKIHSELSTFKTPRLEVFQFLLLKIYYGFVAPEECDCVTYSSSTNIGQLLQYATHCSLNRDPTCSNNATENINKNLLRRLWYEVVHIDSYQLLLVGNPTIVDHKFYDTHFPHLDESENENEYYINQSFYDRARLYDVCYPLLTLVLNIREKPKIQTIKQYVQPLLKFAKELKTLEEILSVPSNISTEKCQKLKDANFIIDSNSVLYMIHYHFFLFYNEHHEKELSLSYLLEMIKVSTILYETILFLDPENTKYDLQKHFGNALLFFPKIELSLHRITQLMFGILTRIKGLKISAGDKGISAETAVIVDKIADTANKVVTNILTSFIHISDTYYHPWVTSKVETYILTNITRFPKGTHYGPVKTPSDLRFLETLTRWKDSDDMFERYSVEDFNAIFTGLSQMDKISSGFKLRIKNDKINSIQWDQKMIGDNDKRWFDRMLHDFIDAGENEFSALDILDCDVRPTEEGDQAQRKDSLSTVSSSKPVSSNDIILDPFVDDLANVESLNDLINANLDLFDFEKMFYYGAGADRSFF